MIIFFQKIRSDEELLSPGGHNMLIYDELSLLERFYTEHAHKYLARDKIALISSQYQPLEKIKAALNRATVDVGWHPTDGTLFIIDAQLGYLPSNMCGTLKLTITLSQRAKKEGRNGTPLE